LKLVEIEPDSAVSAFEASFFFLKSQIKTSTCIYIYVYKMRKIGILFLTHQVIGLFIF